MRRQWGHGDEHIRTEQIQYCRKAKSGFTVCMHIHEMSKHPHALCEHCINTHGVLNNVCFIQEKKRALCVKLYLGDIFV